MTPLLLYLQGLAIPRDMPGGVFMDAIDADFARRTPLREVDTYDSTPLHPDGRPMLADEALDEATLQRLCALGYIECPSP